MASTTVDLLDVDVLSTVLSFLHWTDVLNARVSRKWKSAAAMSPVKELNVKKPQIAVNLERISTALPGLDTLRFDFFFASSEQFYFIEGEDAESGLQLENLDDAPPALVNLAPIQNFSRLQHLALRHTRLNGSYPYLFQLQNLRTLDLLLNRWLKWDLEMLSGLPNLRKLHCRRNAMLTGDLRSVRVLRRTLEDLDIHLCVKVTGSFNELFDFDRLERLDLADTRVTGDIRNIGPSDFKSLKQLELGDGIYGGGNLQSIHEAAEIMSARYTLKKRTPELFQNRRWWLSDDSPEHYTSNAHRSRAPPFYVEFVKAGPRLGWRWTNCVVGGACETYWLDAEPELSSSEDYQDYLEELDGVNRCVYFYRGFLTPPTPEEYKQRYAELPFEQASVQFYRYKSV